MKKTLARGVVVAAALVLVFGSGSGGANIGYDGLTYEDASSRIKASGGTSVISSRVGSYLPTEKCIVKGSRYSSSPSGRSILLDLYCNDASALKGHPGNSVATPQGKRDLYAKNTSTFINDDFVKTTAAGEQSWCEKNFDNCKRFCTTTGLDWCSAEVLQLIGA